LRKGLLVLALLLFTAAVGCDESTAPEESFILTVTVTDTLEQPLEGMAVWRQSHLEGTIPDPPSATPQRAAQAPAEPLLPDSLVTIYPNPFNGLCFIEYWTADARQVFLEVKDWRGRHVKTVFDGVVTNEINYAEWTQRNESFVRMPTGVYTVCLTLTDTLDTHLFSYSAEMKCTAYEDFLKTMYTFEMSLGETDENGSFSTRELDFFPSLQGHEQQAGCDESGDYNGVFSFSDRVTIFVSTVPEPGAQWLYYMSRDIDLVDGPNSMEFVFVPEDSVALLHEP
jgi:hypothetical protein